MAFTGRAPRSDTTIASSLPSNVGPGSYSIDSKRRPPPACVPFGSSQARRITTDFAARTPGPGTYLSADRVRGARLVGTAPSYTRGPSKAFCSKVPRFDSRSERRGDEPGPGNYSLPDEWSKRSASQALRDGVTTPRGATVRFLRLPTAPSIPIPAQSYGYDESDSGDLVQRSPPEEIYSGLRQDTVGPAYYDANLNAIKGTRYADFHRSRIPREPFRTRSAPGPGQYDPRLFVGGQFPGQYESGGGDKRHSVFCSRTQRFGDPKFKVPGPGSYSHKDAFENAHRMANSSSKPPLEGSMRNSFFDSRENVQKPGPGAYDSAQSTFLSAHELRARTLAVGSPEKPPFLTSGKRFARRKAGVPGPGSYQHTGLAPRKAASRYGVFGCTAERATDEVFRANMPPADAPGPGQYDHSITPRAGPARLNPNSIFISESKRFPDFKSEAAPVGLYDVSSTWRRGNKKTAMGAREFDTTEKRFMQDKRLAEHAAQCPGPGAYTPRCSRGTSTLADHSIASTALKSRASRFESVERKGGRRRLGTRMADDPRAPGPGHYLSEGHGSFVKRSFNVTIDADD